MPYHHAATLSPSATPLSARQEVFCHSYVYFPNAANAAREAGYEVASARQQGHRLLRMGEIAARISEIRQLMADDRCRKIGVLLGKLENIYNWAIEDRHYVAAARRECPPRFTRRGPPALMRCARMLTRCHHREWRTPSV